MLNEGIDIPYELIRNLAIILQKRRKGSRQATSSTRQDPSHWELLCRGRGRGRGRDRGSVTQRSSKVSSKKADRGRGKGSVTYRSRGIGRGRGT